MFGWFGRRKPRIRKQSYDLTIADWQNCPVWEGCLDEECLPGQDESTMRPGTITGPIDPQTFDGGVASTCTFANGRQFLGATYFRYDARGGFCGQRGVDLQLLLDRPAQDLTSEQLPEEINQIIYQDARHLAFVLALPDVLPADVAHARIQMVYRLLGVTATEMWPMTVTPRATIKNWPNSWQLNGWMRCASNDLLR